MSIIGIVTNELVTIREKATLINQKLEVIIKEIDSLNLRVTKLENKHIKTEKVGGSYYGYKD